MATVDGREYNIDGLTLMPFSAHTMTEIDRTHAFVAAEDAQSIVLAALRTNAELRRDTSREVRAVRRRIDNGEYSVNDPSLLRSDPDGNSKLWKDSKQMLDQHLEGATDTLAGLKRQHEILKARRTALLTPAYPAADLYEARLGAKRVLLPPKNDLDSPSASHEAFGQFIEKMQQPNGATLIGLDIENDTKDFLDAEGKTVRQKDGKLEQSFDKLTSIGARTATFKSDGSMTFNDKGIDVGTIAYVEKIRDRFGVSEPEAIASLTPIRTKAHNEVDALILKSENYFRNAFRLNPDAFVTVFNTDHDIPSLIKVAEASSSEEVRRSGQYLKEKVLPRVLEASHFAVLSQVERKDSKLQTFIKAILGTNYRQTHTALNDVNQTLQVISESLKKFIGGDTGHFTVQKAENVYVFPKHITREEGVMGAQGNPERLNQSKAPFQVTRVVKEDVPLYGDIVPSYSVYARRITETGDMYGPEEKRLGINARGESLQMRLSQDYNTVTKEGLADAWSAHLSDDVLGDLVGRNVRRMGDEPLGWHTAQTREDVNRGVYSKRDNYIARGRIVREYDQKSPEDQKDFMRDLEKNLSGNGQLILMKHRVSIIGFIHPRGRHRTIPVSLILTNVILLAEPDRFLKSVLRP